MQTENLEGIPSQEKVGVEMPHFTLTPRNKKIALGVGLFLAFVLMLLIVVLIKSGKKPVGRKIPIITPPYFVVTATPPPQPTKWASDSGVLKMQSDLASVSGQLNTVDLNEPLLSLPNIDLHVTFQN